jgi:hypothetical protein
MRASGPEPPPPEAPPDVAVLIRKNLDMIFVATALPRDLEATPATRTERGDAWTACVRAQIISVAGAPLRRQTYRLTIRQNEIIDRRRAVSGRDCVSDDYKPILPTK